MPDINTSTGLSYVLPNEIQPRDNMSATDALFDTSKNVWRGFLDENIIALSALYATKYIFNENPTYELDDNYNIFNDPQLRQHGLESYIGNFMHSRNAEHTTDLIKRFVEKQKQINGSPAYIVGRILGGVTDPSSLFMFTKAGSTVLRLARAKRGFAVGGLIGTEEIGKRYLDDSRPMFDSVLITAGGFIIPTLFPALPAHQAGKKFDKSAQMLDDADDSIFQGGTVGAAAPKSKKWIGLEKQIKELSAKKKKTKEERIQLRELKDELKIVKQRHKLKTEKDYIDENKIQPSGLGIFGEQGPWNVIFRTLKNKNLPAQEFIERTLEGALYQVKNFYNKATSPSIERLIKMRYPNLVVSLIKESESFYTQYLTKMGKSGQNFIERTLDAKFARTTNEGTKVMTPKQFRQQVWRAIMGDDGVVEEAKLAANSYKKFYKTIGTEYDNLKISQMFIEKQIAKLDEFISKTRSNSKKTQFITTKKRLEAKLKYINENTALKKDGYVNLVLKRDQIENRFAFFEPLMREILKKQRKPNGQFKFTQDDIDEIIEEFKNYQPVIVFPNLADEIKLANKTSTMADVEKYIDSINRVSARFRSRDLGLSNEDYIRLADAGFVETDMQILTKFYFNQTIPDIEITKVFGDPMGFGTQWSKNPNVFQRGISQIAEEYDKQIEELRLLGTKKSLKKMNDLIRLKEEALVDADAAIALLRGTYGLHPDPNRSMSRGIRMFKLYNAMTMLTGLAQVVDIARLVSINGITRTFRLSWEVYQTGMWKEIAKSSTKSGQLGGECLDMFQSSRAMAMYGLDDAFGVYGKFEKGMSSLGNLYFTFLNLSNPWNTGVKSIATLFNGTRLLEAIEGLVTKGKITKVNRARLKNLGITDEMAKDIWKEYIQHGFGKGANKYKNGDSYKLLRVANSEAWKNKKAAEAYHQAIGKQVNIDIVTPSKGDVPLWANTEIGGVLSQFKKFGMASTQRMLLRGLQERDAQFLNGVLMLMAAGAMVDAYRQKAFNRDYSKKPTGQKLVDAFDRSGLGGIFSDINNAIERLGNNEIGLRPILGSKKPYGTYRDFFNNPIPDVLGPTTSQIANIGDIMWTWGTGKYNHHTARNVRRLLPFQNVWFLDSLFDEVERDALR